MATYNVHEAETNLSNLITEARNGQRVVIADHGVPQVELCPVSDIKKFSHGRDAAEWLTMNNLPRSTGRSDSKLAREIRALKKDWA